MNIICGIFTLFVILVVDGAAASFLIVQKPCSDEEEYRRDSYESTCDKILDRSWLITSWDGCFCKSGFIRDKKNSCITIEDCSKRVCKNKNSELSLIGRLTVCNGTGTSSSLTYPLGYFPLCTCKSGYALKDHVCVIESECT